MSGFNFSPNTYAGQAAGQFLLAAVTNADMIGGGNVRIIETKSNKYVLPTWQNLADEFVQDPTPDPVSSGTILNGERYLNLGEYLVYQEFNPQQYADHWYAKSMPELLIDRGLPVEANSVILYEIMRQNAKFLNKLIINGNTSLLTNMKYIDGLVTKMSADTAVYKPSGATTLSNTNVATEFDKGYAMLIDALKYDMDVKYYCSYHTFDLYTEYQRNVGTQPYKGIDVTDMGVRRFRGHEVVPVADFPDNTYFITKGLTSMDSNLVMGVNSISDENNLKIGPKNATSDLWFVKGKLKVDVNYIFPTQVVYYGA